MPIAAPVNRWPTRGAAVFGAHVARAEQPGLAYCFRAALVSISLMKAIAPSATNFVGFLLHQFRI